MLTVNMIYDPQYEERFRPFLELKYLLREMSVELLDNSDRIADIPFVQSQLLRDLEGRGDPRVRGPHIINERVDTETVMERELIRRPTTLAWAKECCLRTRSLYNHPLVFDYYHFNFVRHDPVKYPAVEPYMQLVDADIDKICLPFSVASFGRFEGLRRSPSTEPSDRDIDVLMFGTTNYKAEILREHRGDAARAVGRLTRFKTMLAVGYILSAAEMHSLLLRSKIVVCSYGFCMSSYKDWEALYAGCVLIKPDSSEQVNYLPDLYKDNCWYVPCATDFSNLEEKVTMVLDNYDSYYGQSQIARSALMESTDRERRAADFYHLLNRALARTPDRTVPVYSNIQPKTYSSRNWASAQGSRPTAVGDSFKQVTRRAAPVRGPNLFGDNEAASLSAWTMVRSDLSGQRMIGPGGTVADKVVEDTSSGTHDFRRWIAKEEIPSSYSFSFFVRPAGRSVVHVWLSGENQKDRAQASMDLDVGHVFDSRTVGVGWVNLDSGLVSVGDEWWWCWFAVRSADSDKLAILLALDTSERLMGYEGDGKSGAWFAGFRLETGERPTLVLPETSTRIPGL